MAEVPVSFEKSLNLADLRRQLANQEIANGKLVSLGHNATVTVGVYEAGDPPPRRLKLVQAVNGQAVIPVGATKLCDGVVWITNQLQTVVAYRPAA